MQFRQPRRTQPQVQHRAVAAAQAQEGPPTGKLVNRGYGGRGNRRVPGEGIRNRRPQHHPLGGSGHNAQGHVQLAGQRLRVGDAHVVEAHFLRQPRSAGNIREIVGEHGDAEFHVIHNSLFVSHCQAFSVPAARLLILPSAVAAKLEQRTAAGLIG